MNNKTEKILSSSFHDEVNPLLIDIKGHINNLQQKVQRNIFDNYFYRYLYALVLLSKSGIDNSLKFYDAREGADFLNNRTLKGEAKSCYITPLKKTNGYIKSGSFMFCKQDEEIRREEALDVDAYLFVTEDRSQFGKIPLIIYLNTPNAVAAFKKPFVTLQENFIKQKTEWDANGEALKWDAPPIKLPTIIGMPEAQYINNEGYQISEKDAWEMFGYDSNPYILSQKLAVVETE